MLYALGVVRKEGVKCFVRWQLVQLSTSRLTTSKSCRPDYQRRHMNGRIVDAMLFLTFSALAANPKKLLYTVANPARGLLNRENKRKKKKSGRGNLIKSHGRVFVLAAIQSMLLLLMFQPNVKFTLLGWIDAQNIKMLFQFSINKFQLHPPWLDGCYLKTSRCDFSLPTRPFIFLWFLLLLTPPSPISSLAFRHGALINSILYFA